MDHAKLLDVLTSLPVSQSILPRAVCFATSRPANHAICSFIDLSGYASGPIRRRLFIDYILKGISPQMTLNLRVLSVKRSPRSLRHFLYSPKTYVLKKIIESSLFSEFNVTSVLFELVGRRSHQGIN